MDGWRWVPAVSLFHEPKRRFFQSEGANASAASIADR